MHPDYDNKSFEHDVCILKVDDLEQGMDLENNSVADFACLPSGKKKASNWTVQGQSGRFEI